MYLTIHSFYVNIQLRKYGKWITGSILILFLKRKCKLLEQNRSIFRAFYDQPKEKRQQCMMSYDFHIENYNRKPLINHKITQLVTTNEGCVWLALCTISLSSHKNAGHI